MPRLQARSVILRPVEESDLELLKEWRNSTDYMTTCTTSGACVGIEELRKQIASRPFQFMIAHAQKGTIGTIFANKANLIDGHLFITTFLDSSFRNCGYGPIALIMAIDFSFTHYPLRKIYFDVYASNQNSRSSFEGGLKRLGFEREGIFRDHRFQGGDYLDMVRFSIFKESRPLIKVFLEKANRFDSLKIEL